MTKRVSENPRTHANGYEVVTTNLDGANVARATARYKAERGGPDHGARSRMIDMLVTRYAKGYKPEMTVAA